MRDRLPLPPRVPAEAREVAITVPPPRVWIEPETPPDCAGCGAPHGYPCCDDDCTGQPDVDAWELW